MGYTAEDLSLGFRVFRAWGLGCRVPRLAAVARDPAVDRMVARAAVDAVRLHEGPVVRPASGRMGPPQEVIGPPQERRGTRVQR